MTIIELKEMNEEEYSFYIKNKIVRYGEVLSQNLHDASSDSLEKAKEQLATLLPEGRETQNHHLYKIDRYYETIGYVWIKTDEEKKSAFLYEIYIFEKFQSKGYGTKAMDLLEEWLREGDYHYFKLHVFGQNKGAHKLYERLGFGVAGYNMIKTLR